MCKCMMYSSGNVIDSTLSKLNFLNPGLKSVYLHYTAE